MTSHSRKRSSNDGKRVLVAMSGGVDSAVACLLLKQKGFECVGGTIKTWPKEECEGTGGKMCCSLDAVDSARQAAGRLGVPHYVFDLSKEFVRDVRDYYTAEYSAGRTPNPCILCNSEIKFGALFKKADELGCGIVATGHFARIRWDRSRRRYSLVRGKDASKDQSYFLFNLGQGQLSRILFPLGDITKTAVRGLAKSAGLSAHDRPSSQDVCFTVPRGREKNGDIVFREKVVGSHKGVHDYTLGQRKGLGVAYTEPLYVSHLDVKENRVFLDTKARLLRSEIIVDRLNWIENAGLPLSCGVKIRYGRTETRALVSKDGENAVKVVFGEPQFAPTPGQAAVFYKRDRVLGGGWIKDVRG